MRPTILALALLLAPTAHAATFGDQTPYGTSFVIRDVVGAIAASPSQSGVCDSITGYFKFNLDSCKARCALYTISGSDTVLLANGVSEERWFAANALFTWQGFAFTGPKPVVVAGATYFIAAFGDTAGSGTAGLPRIGVITGAGPVISKNSNYESGFPTPLNPTSSTVNFKMSAYVTYTPTPAIAPRRRIVSRP
jgi:hypothetical protein